MGIKEKELEDLILNLLDNSTAIRKKVRNICSIPQDTSNSNLSDTLPSDFKSGLFDKRKIIALESKIAELNTQLDQSHADYQQAVLKIQEYKASVTKSQSQQCTLESEKQGLLNENSRLEKELKKVRLELDTRIMQMEDLKKECKKCKKTSIY